MAFEESTVRILLVQDECVYEQESGRCSDTHGSFECNDREMTSLVLWVIPMLLKMFESGDERAFCVSVPKDRIIPSMKIMYYFCVDENYYFDYGKF